MKSFKMKGQYAERCMYRVLTTRFDLGAFFLANNALLGRHKTKDARHGCDQLILVDSNSLYRLVTLGQWTFCLLRNA